MSETPLGYADFFGKVLAEVASTIDSRAEELDTSTSYTAKLLSKGPERTAKKMGEEAVELAIALVGQDKEEVAGETADLLFHLLVALRSRGVSLEEVANVLAERQGISGLVEKASRPTDGG